MTFSKLFSYASLVLSKFLILLKLSRAFSTQGEGWALESADLKKMLKQVVTASLLNVQKQIRVSRLGDDNSKRMCRDTVGVARERSLNAQRP